MPEIKLRNVTKRWGKFYAVDNLSLDIADNSFVTLLGPSGCGKTTILRMIAGLETPTNGQITIGDRVVFDSEAGINVPANKRKVGFLFQNYALWPNMTVYQNIAFGLSNIKEELPTYDFEAKTAAELIHALKHHRKIVEITRECVDKKGKLDTTRAKLKFIDSYTLSMDTAKRLLEYRLHEAADPKAEAERLSLELQTRLEAIRSSYREKGKELNRDFAVMKDGKVETSVRKLAKEEVDQAVRRVARIVKIGMFMDRYPAELSGGQQQRVAIARTLAPEPEVLFMDEPLSNLDAKLRLEMRYELQRLHVETGSTFVYVTHDQMEAMTLATKICLVNNGVLQQYEAPLTVYNRPGNLFVADFVGNPSINFVEARGTQEADGSIRLSMLDDVTAVFYPETSLNLAGWLEERNHLEMEQEAHRHALLTDKKAVEKGNKDETFRYHIARVDEEDYGIQEEPTITDGDFVLGIRPEFLALEKSVRNRGVGGSDSDGSDSGSGSGADGSDGGGGSGLEADIYGSMPTGMESTVKLRIGKYLLTGVVFGKSTYQIGEKAHIDFKGRDILLYDRKSGRFVAAGALKLGSNSSAIANEMGVC